jgi:hypothetical protein
MADCQLSVSRGAHVVSADWHFQVTRGPMFLSSFRRHETLIVSIDLRLLLVAMAIMARFIFHRDQLVKELRSIAQRIFDQIDHKGTAQDTSWHN